MRTKNLYGIKNKDNGVVCIYVMTCHGPATISTKSSKLNFRKSIIPGTIGLFETNGNLAEIVNRLKENKFEYGSSAKLFTICMKVNRSIRTSS